MRSKFLILIFLLVVTCMLAGNSFVVQKRKGQNKKQDTISSKDSNKVALPPVSPVDTTALDSLQRAIYQYNKHIDDSIRLDSINKTKATGIDAPVTYQANDSLVYDAYTKKAYLYGSSQVKYEKMDLTSEKINMSLDSSLVHATGVYADTTNTKLKGTPVFKMGSDTYDNDTIAFNFKSKKGLITNVHTKQQEGFLSSKIAKRDGKGIYTLNMAVIQHVIKIVPTFILPCQEQRFAQEKMSFSDLLIS